jgi:hypothetical protein
VHPERTPHVVRSCPRCGCARPFVSSDRFRVNASGRKLDVWLIYRCAHCDFTWNLTVLERMTPETIGPPRLAAYHDNDRETAWRCAFAVQTDDDVPVRVERAPLPPAPATIAIRFELVHEVKVRLERLLANELGLSRSQVARNVEDERMLRRPVRNDQVVVVRITGP